MNSSSAIKMPDGTICRKGASCKRHGVATFSPKPSQKTSATSKSQQGSRSTPSTGNVPASLLGMPTTPPTGFLDDKTPRKYAGDKITYYERARQCREYFRNIPKEDEKLRDSLSHYMYTGNEYINPYLRDGKDFTEFLKQTEASGRFRIRRGEEEQYKEMAEYHIQNMDTVLEKLPHEPENSVVYRAVPGAVGSTMKVGDTVYDAGYMSTSEDPQLMLMMEERSKADGEDSIVVFEILTSRNKFIGGISRDGLAAMEKEHLLPRGTHLKAVAVKTIMYEAHEAPYDRSHNGFRNSIRRKRMKVVQMVDVTDETVE